MATKETWEKVQKYFPRSSETDNWGDHDAISDDLLLVLFDFRKWIGVPIHVLWGTNGRHADGSFHYVRNGAVAADLAIPDYAGTPIDLLFDVFRFDFRGVGFYPDWNFNGKQAKGIHLDRRTLKMESDHTLDYRERRWLGVKETIIVNGEEKKKQIYLPLTHENLKQRGALAWN